MAHPMSTIEGVKKAYSFQYKDGTRRNNGGRISWEEFFKLESGQYGKVEVVDYRELVKRYRYPFMQQLSFIDAATEELVKARLGKDFDAYLRVCLKFSLDAEYEEKIADEADPYILTMADASNCCYREERLQDGFGAIAHLLSVGYPCITRWVDDETSCQGLIHDIGCHEWSNGTRFIGVKANSDWQNIHSGTDDLHRCFSENWSSLMVPVFPPKKSYMGVRILCHFGGFDFTEVPKVGECMDTGEPEFLVRFKEKVGEPIVFRTTIGGYHGFVKYGLREVQIICPRQANVYSVVSDWRIIQEDGSPKWHEAQIQFYQADIDTSRTMMDRKRVGRDFNKVMEILKNCFKG